MGVYDADTFAISDITNDCPYIMKVSVGIFFV